MERPRAFWGALAAALAGHGLLLVHIGVATPRLGSGGRAPVVVQVQASVQAVHADPQASNRKAPPPSLAATEPLLAAPPAWQPEPPAWDGGAAAAEPGFEGYLERRWLTAAASPLQAVDVPFPDVEGTVDLKLQATLFIDEEGVVRHVRIDTPRVHEAFAGAVMATFSDVRFKPGEVAGQPVRSQLRLEVEFQAGLQHRRAPLQEAVVSKGALAG